MNKEFTPYEQALELKELGFKEGCIAIYSRGLSEFDVANIGKFRLFSSVFRINDEQSNISYINKKETVKVAAPLYQQVFKWFRENYELHACTTLTSMKNYGYLIEQSKFPYNLNEVTSYKTYEEAQLACLKKLIEISKNK